MPGDRKGRPYIFPTHCSYMNCRGIRKGCPVRALPINGLRKTLNLVFLPVASFRMDGMWKDNDLLQDMIDGHFKFYKHVNDDPEFAKTFLDLLFERYLGRSKR